MGRVWVAIALSLSAACAGAPAKPPSGSPPPQNPAESWSLPPEAPAEFTLEPGDTLAVTVYRHSDLDVTSKVGAGGRIRVPLIGDVDVVGRTVEQIRADITKRLGERYLANPQVNVQITQFSPRRVYVLGEVRTPREHSIPENGRLYLLQLLSAAGGLQESAAHKEVRLIRTSRENRADRRMYRIPLARIEVGEVPDVLLAPEDVVIILPEARIVYVLGAVKNPNGYAMPEAGSFTLAQAIATAGGLGKFAAPKGVQILRQTADRKQITLTVDLSKVMDGDLSEDRELQAGDIIVVPTGFW